MIPARKNDARANVGVCLTVCLGVILTVASQMEGRIQILYAVTWFSLFVYLAVRLRGRIILSGNALAFPILVGFCFVFCSICYFVTGEEGYLTGHFMLISKVLLMYLVGYVVSWAISERYALWRIVLYAYIAASCTYAVWVYANYFPGYTAWLSSVTYAFASKNSFGQIAAMALLCCVGLIPNTKKKGAKLLLAGAGVFLFLMILFMQCRTTTIALALCAVVYLVIQKQRRAALVAAILLIAFLLIATVPSVQSLVFHSLFLDKYQGADLNTMSSGRVQNWLAALAKTAESPFIGLGEYYVDCFYINLFANVGLIGSFIFLAVWFKRIVNNAKFGQLRSLGVVKSIQIVLLLSIPLYLVESVLEGWPPFGPGTCSFMFWLLGGFCDWALIKNGGDA